MGMTIFVYYGLPLHIIRDLCQSYKNLTKKYNTFRQYRALVANMDSRFPDATPEQLADEECVICREPMTEGKVLDCGHVFHFRCIRKWLAYPQGDFPRCPHCRARITVTAS